MQHSLQQALIDLKLVMNVEQQAQLLDYLSIMAKWNRTHNLTAITEPAAMLIKHGIDSLAVLPHLRGQYFADVGSGAGLPGIPLAIASPDRQFTLIDSRLKRVQFCQHVVHKLGLNNVQVVHSRVEDYRPAQTYHGVLSRAFTQLVDMVQKTGHLCRDDGCLLAMKGIYPQPELDGLAALAVEWQVIELHVPGLDEQRHLVQINFKQVKEGQGGS